MATAVLVALLATQVPAQIQQLTPPSISADLTDVTASIPTGDLKLATSVPGCTQSSPCGVAATLSTMQATISAQASMIAELQDNVTAVNGSLSTLSMNAVMSIDLQQSYATSTQIASTYVPLTSMTTYATEARATELANNARLYAADLVQALANLTLNATADIVFTHQNLGLLHDNGTYFGDIVINSASELISMAPLLSHVTAITGNLRIQSVNQPALTDLSTGLFTNLASVDGYVWIQSCPSLTSIGNNAFPVLTSIGGQLLISNNNNLASLGSAFPRLQSIGGPLSITSNAGLTGTTVGSAFSRLQAVGGVNLGSSFSPSTGIYVGDIICYPGQTNAISLSQASTLLSNKYVLTGMLRVSYQPSSMTSLPSGFGSSLRSIGGQLRIERNYGLNSLNGVFPNLGAIGGDLYIYYNTPLNNFGNAFSQLRMIYGSLTFSYHRTSSFTSMANAFPQLRNITGGLVMQYNDYLQNMQGAFPQLRWVNSQINFHYLYRLSISPTWPQLEYAGGVRYYYCFYYSTGSTSQRNMNSAFPRLMRVGTSGIYFYYNQYLMSMNNAFPQLVQNDGYFYLYYSRYMTSFSNSFTRMAYVRQYFQFSGQQALQSFNGNFNGLTSVGTYLYIQSNSFTTLTNSFTNLQTVGSNFYLTSNSQLSSIQGSFTSLRSVGNYFYIYTNYQLRSIGNAFSNFQSCSRLYFYGNGASYYRSGTLSQFCTSARSELCPSTTTYQNSGWSYDTDDCCNSFCNSSPLC